MADEKTGGMPGFSAANREAGTLDNTMRSIAGSVEALIVLNTLYGDRFGKVNKEAGKLEKSSKEIVKNFGSKLLKYWKVEIPYSIIKSFKAIDDHSTKIQRNLNLTSIATRRSLADATIALQRYGMGMDDVVEGMLTTYDVLRNTNKAIGVDNSKLAGLISRAYGMSISEGAKYVAKIQKYTQMSTSQIKSLTEKIGTMSKVAMVSTGEVLRDITDNMEDALVFGTENMTKMSIQAQKMGMSLRSVLNMRNKFTDLSSTMEIAARLAQEGGQLGALGNTGMLVRAGNTQPGMDQFLIQLQKSLKSQLGPDNKVGFQTERIFRRISDTLGVSYEELVRSATMTEEMLALNKAQGDKLEKIAKVNTTITDLLGGFKAGLFEGFTKIFAKFDLDKVKQTIFSIGMWTSKIASAMPYIIGLLAARKIAQFGFGLFGKGPMGGALGGGPGKLAKSIVDQVIGNRKGVGAPGMGMGDSVPAMGGGGVGKMMGSVNWKVLASSAGAIIATAGAMWILSRALINFNQVDWESLKKAGIALSGMAVGMLALGGVMVFPGLNAAIVAGVLNFGLLAGGMWVLSKAAQNLASSFVTFNAPFVGFSNQVLLMGSKPKELAAAAAGIGGISVAMASLGAGSVVAGVGRFFGGNQIGKIIDLADKSSGLQVAAASLKAIGENFGVMAINVKDMDMAKLRSTVDALTTLTKPSSHSRAIPIENHLTINLGGQQFKEFVERSFGALG